MVNKGATPWNKGKKKINNLKLGAKLIDASGYVNIYRGSLSKRKSSDYELEHRMVMEEALGRDLLNTEIVHHIDGNKLHNLLDNLFLCNSVSHHRKVHAQLESISMLLVSSELIIFDKEIGEYRLAPKMSDLLSGVGEFGEPPNSNAEGNTEPSIHNE